MPYKKTYPKGTTKKWAKKTYGKYARQDYGRLKTLRPEMKMKSTTLENYSTLVLGQQLQPLIFPCKIDGGINEDDRIGNQVVLRGIHIRGHLFNRSGNPALMYRMALINDKETNITDFTGGEFLVKSGANVNYNQGTESSYLPLNKTRYSVYWDKVFKLSALNTNGENIKMFSQFIKFNQPIKFGGNGSGSVKGHNLQLVGFPINPSGTITTSEVVKVSLDCATYFQDP